MSDAREAARNAKASMDGLRAAAAQAETSPQPNDRAEMQEARTAGLRARHETREARAVRRQVGEFIAELITDYPGPDPSPASPAWWAGYEEAKRDCALIARSFGTKTLTEETLND